MRELLTDFNFWMLLIGFSIGLGMFNSVLTLVCGLWCVAWCGVCGMLRVVWSERLGSNIDFSRVGAAGPNTAPVWLQL